MGGGGMGSCIRVGGVDGGREGGYGYIACCGSDGGDEAGAGGGDDRRAGVSVAGGDEATEEVRPPLVDLLFRSPNSARKLDDLRFTAILRCLSTLLNRYPADTHCSRFTANSSERTSADCSSSESVAVSTTSDSFIPLAFSTSARSIFCPASTIVTRTSLPSSTSVAHTACTGDAAASVRLACCAAVCEVKRMKAVVGVGWKVETGWQVKRSEEERSIVVQLCGRLVR